MTSARAFTRALGLSNLTPANIVKQITGTNSLAYADYVTFWGSVQRTQSGATKMMIELLNKFVELDKQFARRLRANPKDALKEQDRTDRLLWMIVNTIRFVDLFLGVEANNPHLRKAHRALEAHRVEFPATTASAREMDAFLKTVFRSAFEMADTTNALVMELAFVNSVEWTLETGGTRDSSFSVLRDCPFIGLRLLAKVSMGGRDSYTVFFEMAKQLASMPSLIRAQPALMNSTLGNTMALLFFIQESIRFYPVLDRQILQKLMEAIKQFRFWPLPYGSFARSLMNMIKIEMRAPGTALRARLRAENPLLTDYGEFQADRFGSQGVDWASAHRVVTVLHNSTIMRSHLLRKLISRGLFKNKAWNNEMQLCREELLVSLIEASFVSEKEDGAAWHNSVTSALRNRHQADVVQWYTRGMRCVNQESGVVDATQLLAVVRDISPALAEGIHPRVAQTRLDDEDMTETAGDEDEDILTELETIKKEPFDPSLWAISAPRLPFLSFEFLEIFSASQRRAMTQEGGLLRGGGPPADDDDDYSQLFTKGRATGPKATNQTRRAKTRASLTIPGLDSFNLNPAFEGEIDPFGVKGQHQVPQKYVAYPSDFEELVKDARLILPPDEALNPGRSSFARMNVAANQTSTSKSSSKTGKQARQESKKGKDEKVVTFEVATKPVLKRVILGGLDVLHRALCTYVALLAVDPQLGSRIDFQFFLVPLGRNDLSAFIAQRDGWYRKHVFVPFHGPLVLVPQCKSDLSASSSTGHTESSGMAPDAAPRLSGMLTSPKAAAANPNRRTSAIGGKITPPSNFDSDFGDNNGTGGLNGGAEEDILDTLEDGGGFNNLASDVPAKKHKLDATPAKLLRPLMESYVRGAQNVFPVTIYDCECWESPDAIEVDRNPDVTIPFCIRVELGLGAAIAAHSSSLEFTTNFEGRSVNEGLGTDPSFEEILNDKSFLKAIGGTTPDLKITTPELTVNMYTMGIDGTLDDRFVLELADSHYLSLIISSVPRFTFPSEASKSQVMVEPSEPPATAANPSFPWLEVQSVAAKPNAVELVKKKDKKLKDVDSLQETLKYESKTHHIGFLDIRSTLASRVPFVIAVDGQTFGPYYRVRIRRSTALSASGGQAVMSSSPKVSFPIMTFLPLDGA